MSIVIFILMSNCIMSFNNSCLSSGLVCLLNIFVMRTFNSEFIFSIPMHICRDLDIGRIAGVSVESILGIQTKEMGIPEKSTNKDNHDYWRFFKTNTKPNQQIYSHFEWNIYVWYNIIQYHYSHPNHRRYPWKCIRIFAFDYPHARDIFHLLDEMMWKKQTFLESAA